MSDSEEQLPAITVPRFTDVVTDLLTASRETIAAGGVAVRFRARGDSMYPFIRDGESITVGPASIHDVVRGDVLLCRHAGRILAHRVVSMSTLSGERVLYLRGDAKQGCDAPVREADVIGRVLSVHRHGRTIPMSGARARLRYRAHTALSRAKMLAMLVFGVPPRVGEGS